MANKKRTMDSTLKLTSKLKGAIEILSDERFADCDPDEFLKIAKRKRISSWVIYQAVMCFGYRWKNNSWQRVPVQWLEQLTKQVEND